MDCKKMNKALEEARSMVEGERYGVDDIERAAKEAAQALKNLWRELPREVKVGRAKEYFAQADDGVYSVLDVVDHLKGRPPKNILQRY